MKSAVPSLDPSTLPTLHPQDVRLALVVDPLLRHPNRVGVGLRRRVAHHIERRRYVGQAETTALVDAHQRFGAPASAVRLVRLRLDPPALVLDVRHVRLRSLPLRLARLPGIGEAAYASDLPAPRRPGAEALPNTTASVPRVNIARIEKVDQIGEAAQHTRDDRRVNCWVTFDNRGFGG